ncbi:MAG: ABC transporter permease [Jatrophihabitans sp.]|uniref:ABC transporter permease n=1 Tax=Jatrophihabitans sp. TaxID=1932789 RepID=UPI003F81F7E2
MRGGGDGGLTFAGLVLHNIGTRKLRLAFASTAVAIGVMTVVTFTVVKHSLHETALGIMQTGRADFTISQRGVSDLLDSTIDQATLASIAADRDVAAATGVLIGTTRLTADNPLFLEFGIRAADLDAFGVRIVAGRPFADDSANQLLLGWRAAANLRKHVGDTIAVDGHPFHVVGIFSTGQALGDAGTMLPLVPFQAAQRQPGGLTLVFVRARPGADLGTLRARIEHDHPQLVTVRTAADFGRADRSLALINAADRGSTVLAVLIGAVVVMTTMTLTFIERTREFGVLAAIGWSSPRIARMVIGEALAIGLLGAAGGVVLSFAATQVIGQLPSLVGILHPVYTATAFWRALLAAGSMSLLGGIAPAVRAARLSPLEALRHE